MKLAVDRITQAIDEANRLVKEAGDHRPEVFTAVLTMLLIEEQSIPIAASKRVNVISPSLPKRLAPAEFFALKRPETDMQAVLVAAYFLERFENRPCYTVPELRECFFQAKAKPPANINLAVYGNIKRGLMMEANEKREGRKAWLLTGSGEEVIEAGFESEEKTV